MDPNKMESLEKIEVSQNLLDKLTDAQGRAKCGYIYIINELLDALRNDILIMKEQIKDAALTEKNDETVST